MSGRSRTPSSSSAQRSSARRKRRAAIVELPPHADILAALPGEEEGHPRASRVARPPPRRLRARGAQGDDRLRGAGRRNGQAVRHVGASALAPRSTRRRAPRRPRSRDGRRSAAPARPAPARTARESASTCTGRSFGRGGAGERSGASSSTTCALVPLKPNELTPARRGRSPARPRQRARSARTGSGPTQRHARVELREVQVRRDGAVPQGQHHLDEPGDPRRRPRGGRCSSSPSRARSGRSAGPPSPEHGAQRLDLDRDRRARCRCRAPRRSRRRRARRRPRRRAWRITASCARPFGAVRPLLAAVLVDRRAADDREDRGRRRAARRRAA